MAFKDIPGEYQPGAVRLRAMTIADAMTSIAASPLGAAAARRQMQRYTDLQTREQDEHVSTILKTVAETGADQGKLTKARYMLEAARSVLHSDMDPLTEQVFTAGSRQAIVNLGLEYFDGHPRAFTKALGTNPRPSFFELERMSIAAVSSPQSHAADLATMPAPAALALLGITNSLKFVLQIQSLPKAEQQAVPYYLNIVAAWHQVGQQLAAPLPDEPPAAAEKESDWPPAWLLAIGEDH